METKETYRIGFIFYKSKTPLAKLLQWWTEGEFNHVAIQLMNDGVIFEANGHNPLNNGVQKAKHALENHGGVAMTLKIQTEYEFMTVDKHTYEVVKQFLNSVVGQKYDYFGAANFVNRKVKGKPNHWYCSELASVVFHMIIRRGTDPIALVSPQRLFDQITYYKLGAAIW